MEYDLPFKKNLLLNFPLGLFIGLISAFCIAAIIDAEVSNIVSAEIPSFISGVIIILIPTSFATAGVWWNISNQIRLAEEVRKRELESALMSLPHTLNEFKLICIEYINFFANYGTSSPIELEKLDIRIVEVFKSIIKHKDSSKEEPLLVLLSFYRICLYSSFYFSEQSEHIINNDERKKQLAKNIILWTKLSSLITANYAAALNQTKESIISDAKRIFERDLPLTTSNDSNNLTEDEIFESLFKKAIASSKTNFYSTEFN